MNPRLFRAPNRADIGQNAVRKELSELVEKFEMDPTADFMSQIHFSSWSVAQLKEYLLAADASFKGLTEKKDRGS